MRLAYLLAAPVALIVLGAAAWFYADPGARTPAAVEATEESPSVLVKTVAVKKTAMPLTMEVFGDVGTGKVEALSFPQAGQLSHLNVVPGQPVHRGDVIAVLASDPNARVAYAQADNAAAFARRELQRNQDLLALKLATQAQVDTAARQVQDAQAALDAQARLGGASAAPRLLAPFDGVVTAAPAVQGERIAAGAAVVQLGRSDALRVILAIEPASSAALAVGMPVSLHAVQATIAALQNMVDPRTRMTTAVVLLPAARQAGLAPGMQVQATIELGRRMAWTVPRSAVLSDGHSAYLFQVRSGKAHRVDVETVVDAGAELGVSGLLDGAAAVIVLGNYELADGMPLRAGAR
jgi:membrane fusion protein (multidrug efflux system)